MIAIDVVMPRLFAEGSGELRVKVNLEPGSLTALVGPSGSGKTTLLRVVAGLDVPQQGRIVVDNIPWLDNEQRINRPPQQRSVGYVFQDTALFPNMTVLENIQFAALKDQHPLIQELIDVTGLDAFRDQKPLKLSGGQRQRVALARALVRRPQLLLLDEPFAALDAQASQALRLVLLELHKTWGTTTLLVSHHAIDVQTLADRVITLVQGHIESDRQIEQRSESVRLQERITRIEYDEARHQWVVETETTQLTSKNPAWSQRRVGDWIRFDV
ncbi:ATP-binding cassette domain-containing protein [Spirosoma sp. BT702]|uniref:ATP-binding cassette domain-containing protein n=1 Tax=Spirosoma profusum TaxID=2771354 RepID=A0A927AV53_9BACT|nr:ATP-binding cassette domain-containing protein [Spirosoma profusum]MBD2704971.1 ATP-binding cassette domain-containing protein [Spirosoma profusum]